MSDDGLAAMLAMHRGNRVEGYQDVGSDWVCRDVEPYTVVGHSQLFHGGATLGMAEHAAAHREPLDPRTAVIHTHTDPGAS